MVPWATRSSILESAGGEKEIRLRSVDDCGQRGEATMPQRGIRTARPHVEAGDCPEASLSSVNMGGQPSHTVSSSYQPFKCSFSSADKGGSTVQWA